MPSARKRNLAFVLWTKTPPPLPSLALRNARELWSCWNLSSPSYGVSTPGIYIIDDDGEHVCAGPFDSEIAAIAWIDLRQQNFVRHPRLQGPGMH